MSNCVKKLTIKRLICLAGRNQTGQIVSFHRGKRVPRRYRLIDFNRYL
jgi:ribosomal protein L2